MLICAKIRFIFVINTFSQKKFYKMMQKRTDFPPMGFEDWQYGDKKSRKNLSKLALLMKKI